MPWRTVCRSPRPVPSGIQAVFALFLPHHSSRAAAGEEPATNLEGFLPAARNDRPGADAVMVVDGWHGRSADSSPGSHGSTYSAPAVVLNIDQVGGEDYRSQPQRLCSAIRPHSISVAMAIARTPMHHAERSSWCNRTAVAGIMGCVRTEPIQSSKTAPAGTDAQTLTGPPTGRSTIAVTQLAFTVRTMPVSTQAIWKKLLALHLSPLRCLTQRCRFQWVLD